MNPDYGPKESTTFLLHTNIFMIFLNDSGKRLDITLIHDTTSSFQIIPTPTSQYFFRLCYAMCTLEETSLNRLINNIHEPNNP
jgi:hypothetical protein